MNKTGLVQRSKTVKNTDQQIVEDEDNDNTFYTTPKSFETLSNFVASQQDNSGKNFDNMAYDLL
jgi:hypothetical protein